MIHVFYDDKFNIDLGVLNYIHPFDGLKFKKIFNSINTNSDVVIHSSISPISMDIINEFTNELVQMLIVEKVPVMRALEIPNIPFVSFKYIDKKVLLPMRCGVNATLKAAALALTGEYCWNLSGGYHHASQHSMEGFCIYNDIGITYQELIKTGELLPEDNVLIIDTDAHHGNGNARTFIDNNKIKILDVYNESIYPLTHSTRKRINFPIPLPSGVMPEQYLSSYQKALNELTADYKLAFIVAGTDVLKTDKLGGMNLTSDDVVKREMLTLSRLKELKIPAVFLGAGGYSKESAQATSASIIKLSQL
ncbi:histone deacetylase [Colwellia sp. UCD-KL20]|uniref:histone deacetylase n=1 Tax=Colwellia sp. UCD-KL20 TaxID=1917165 RepID=UPI00257020AD|nr:histone deacetylase [Colwellia sp. UCD-KL20]